jgi:hypothetical protein
MKPDSQSWVDFLCMWIGIKLPRRIRYWCMVTLVAEFQSNQALDTQIGAVMAYHKRLIDARHS